MTILLKLMYILRAPLHNLLGLDKRQKRGIISIVRHYLAHVFEKESRLAKFFIHTICYESLTPAVAWRMR